MGDGIDINASAAMYCNVLKTMADFNGEYIYFDGNAFESMSMYWTGPYIMWASRQVFPKANIVYVDCDAIVFWEIFLRRLPPLSEACLLYTSPSPRDRG